MVNFDKKEFGSELRLQYQKNELKNVPIVPNAVEYEDIDRAFFHYFEENLVNIDETGKEIPTFTLYSNQRFSEYSQMWEHSDEDGNLFMNFKTINRENNPNFGSLHGNKYNIPGNNRFTVRMKETVDKNGIECYEVISMSQPLQVDLKYRINFVTSKFENLNEFNMKLQSLFQSRQCYLQVNGHYMPMVLDTIGDETNYSIEDRKFFIQSAGIDVLAYIIPKDDIKTDLYPKKTKIKYRLNQKTSADVNMDFDEFDNFELSVHFPVGVDKVIFEMDDNGILKIDNLINIRTYQVFINDEECDISSEIGIQVGDEIKIKIKPENKRVDSYLKLKGELFEAN